ncbi:MAG: 5-oxoprolinase subunit PxpA [Isosphaeraceae bacterium]
MSDSESRAGEARLPMVRGLDLNADLGEGCPNDEALLRIVSSASVCCGAHAGGPDSVRATLSAALERGVIVGAHPGYPDRETFGRRPRMVTADDVECLIAEQVETLGRIAGECGGSIRFLKPHGALYNQAQREEEAARGVVATARRLGLPLLGQPGTPLAAMAAEAGLAFIPEGFPDRRTRADGSLVPRSEPGAVLHEPQDIEQQVVRLVEEGQVATICIHGDEPSAVANAELVRRILKQRGVVVRSFLT